MIALLYLFRLKEGQVAACAIRNLCYASVLSDLQAVRRSKSLASARHNEERERVSEGTAADCPFLMSEQRPQNIKLYSIYARSNNQAQRKTEIL